VDVPLKMMDLCWVSEDGREPIASSEQKQQQNKSNTIRREAEEHRADADDDDVCVGIRVHVTFIPRLFVAVVHTKVLGIFYIAV